MRDPLILAVEGHDASGKTTLARDLAAAIDAAYVRPYGGDVGPRLLVDAAAGRSADVSRAGLEAVRDCIARSTAPVLVFDRHWMTVFTLTHEADWEAWKPLPPTLLCWSDLATTLGRLGSRGENPGDVDEHAFYIAKYHELARRFRCEIVPTDILGPTDALTAAVRWARTILAGSGVEVR